MKRKFTRGWIIEMAEDIRKLNEFAKGYITENNFRCIKSNPKIKGIDKLGKGD